MKAPDGIACGVVGSCATPNMGFSHELVGVPRMVGVRGAIPAQCVCVFVCQCVLVWLAALLLTNYRIEL